MTTLSLLLSALLCGPAFAAQKRSAGPIGAPLAAPALPAAAVPNAPAIGIAGTDAGAPAAAVSAAAGAQGSAAASGPQAVAAGVAAAAKDAAPGLEAARQGDGASAAAAGRDLQGVLEGRKPAAASGTVEAPPAAAVEPALSQPRALRERYALAHAAAVETASREKLGAPRFVEAWRERWGWQFHFTAGGRHVRAAVYDGQKRGERAWSGSEFAPAEAQALTPEQLAKKAKLSPRQALDRGAAAFGVPPENVGVSLTTLEKSRSLWFVVDAEDGRRMAVNASTGKTRAMPAGPGRDRVEAAARALASQKGRPYSQTEYNVSYAGYEDSLRRDGATRAQLALFSRLMAATPIRGGGFNSWSGD